MIYREELDILMRNMPAAYKGTDAESDYEDYLIDVNGGLMDPDDEDYDENWAQRLRGGLND